MNDLDLITILQTEELKPWVGHYCFTKDANHHWLQRIALWALHKLGCQYSEIEAEVEFIQFKPSDLMDKLFSEYAEIQDRFDYRMPCTVIIGGEDFAKLISQPIPNSCFDFKGSMQVGGVPSVTCFGYSIQVVPWLKGAAIIPKLK